MSLLRPRRGFVKLAVISLGLAGAYALTSFLQSLIYQTFPEDPLMVAAVCLVLLLTAVLAGGIPAYRANRADVASLLLAE